MVQATKWLPGKISEVLGTRNYMVETGGQLCKRHVDQLLKSQVETQTSVHQDVDLRDSTPVIDEGMVTVPEATNLPTNDSPPETPEASSPPNSKAEKADMSRTGDSITMPDSSSPKVRRYPTRTSRPPTFLRDYEH